MKLADTPGRVYRAGVYVPTASERAERYATVSFAVPKPFVWPFPLVRGTDGLPVSPIWRARSAT